MPAGALLEFKPPSVLLAFLYLWFVFAVNFEKLSALSTSAVFSSFFCLLLTPALREVVSRFLDPFSVFLSWKFLLTCLQARWLFPGPCPGRS